MRLIRLGAKVILWDINQEGKQTTDFLSSHLFVDFYPIYERTVFHQSMLKSNNYNCFYLENFSTNQNDTEIEFHNLIQPIRKYPSFL